MLENLKQLKLAFCFGGAIFVISLLNNLAVDFYGGVAALSSFLILAIHDLGKKYAALTNQSAVVKHAFGTIVNPLLAIICVSSLLYVCVNEMVWYFWLVAGFFALIMFAVESTAFLGEIKKS